MSEITGSLRKEQFDFVVDLQKNFRSIKLRRALKRPNASFPKLNKQKWLIVNFKKDLLPDIHVVDRYFEAVKSLGVTNDNKGLDYFIPDDEQLEAGTVNPLLRKDYIGFVIGGRHNTKMMPAEKVASIISRLERPVVLLGGAEDREKGEQIKKEAEKEDIINTCGQYSLNQSASLVQQSGLIITNDTGLMHIAAAFRKPVISLWGNTIPKFGMYPYMPGDETRSVFAEVFGLKCRPCSKLGFNKCPKKHFKCMIEQDEVYILDNADKLLKHAGES
jgi:heptosyltransferase-2